MSRKPMRWLAFLLAFVLSIGILAGCQPAKEPVEDPGRVPVSEERVPVEESQAPEAPEKEPSSEEKSEQKPAEQPSKVPAKPEPEKSEPAKPQPPKDGAITNGKYPPIPADVMPIGAWVAPPRANINNRQNPSFITDAQYKMLSESGINLIYGLYETMGTNDDDVMKSLDLCKKYNIKYLVRDGRMNEPDEALMRRALSEYATHPAFAGVKVQDEPGTASFGIYQEGHPIFKKLVPDKYYYINLLPSYATPSQLQYGAATSKTDGTMTYDRYLDEYIQKVKPQFLSYDYYCIGGLRGTVQQGYFNELSTYRKLSLKHNIPFWVFIQSCGFGNMRVPNREEILWQVNTSLAYGAKGIQYFCYFVPLESPAAFPGNFVDKNGKKTPIYDYGQEANRQIAACDKILMSCRSKGVIVTGKSIDETIPAADKLQKYGRLSSVTARGSGFLTGCFDHKGKEAFYVASNSITEGGTVTLNFAKSVSGTYIQNGIAKTFKGASLELTMGAGEGALIALS